MMCACVKSRGFTLLELILALALSVGVTVILGSSLYVAFRTKAVIEQTVDAARASGIAVDILAREISLALPPSPGSDTEDASLGLNLGEQSMTLIGPFQGDEQSLDFYISDRRCTYPTTLSPRVILRVCELNQYT